MNVTEILIAALKESYRQAPDKQMKTSIHLFGKKFSDQLEGQPVNEIAEAATGRKSYGTEIRTGMRLAKYVDLKQA